MIEHQGGNENLLKKLENLSNSADIHGNEVSWNFRKPLRTTKPPKIIEKLLYKYGSLQNNNVMNDI